MLSAVGDNIYFVDGIKLVNDYNKTS